jgi:hypothetical protein
MAEKKKFLLRIDPDLYDALERWASDELRSANAQIEYLLKDAIKKAKREKASSTANTDENAQ